MEKWIHENLSGLLGFTVPAELIQYILQMKDSKDVDEFLWSLLDQSNPQHRQFIVDLRNWGKDTPANKSSQKNIVSTKKRSEEFRKEDFCDFLPKFAESKNDTEKTKQKSEKKKKFVNLYSQDTILLKGRYKCDCEAKTHALINNCINCGRIVCVQEGSGPCFCCGNLVCSPEDQIKLNSKGKQSNSLYNSLMERKPNKSLENSMKHRDKLLEYDRTTARRTKVIDDESDYYQSNSSWLSRSEREVLQKKEEEIQKSKHKSRLEKKIAVDFSGNEVNLDDDIDEEELSRRFLEEFNEQLVSNNNSTVDICPTIEFDRPMYVELNSRKLNPSMFPKNNSAVARIQDKESLEMVDEGVCLSMHQPYASLLVAGIKRHEGRTWYSSHRGRLWIASAAKPPDPQEIAALENTYRVLIKENIKFPDNYPTGCLLGCVTVVDVLPQEEYRKVYPEGESDSPYVFICEDPFELLIRFPMQGKHKIYKLDKKIHQAALKSLEKLMKIRST